MKRYVKRFISLFMCLALMLSVCSTGVLAAEPEAETVAQSKAVELDRQFSFEFPDVSGIFAGLAKIDSIDTFVSNLTKVLYNVLNIVVEKLVKSICNIYPDPADWESIDNYTGENYLPGRSVYQTSADEGNYWSLGYASRSIIPEDIENGSYYIGRDLMNKKAVGVYDDQRIRVTVIDDNSGEGAVVLGVIDSLGVTSTDVRSIRAGVLEYCKANNIDVASINITATHCHSALDTQGVSTEFFYKLFANGLNNKLQWFDELPFLEAPTYFKQYFIEQSIIAIKEAFADVEAGSMYFSSIDASEFIEDKRGLVSKEDIPEIASLYFVPDSGSEATYISDISCHPTSFSANHNLVGSDYIYYLDQYIKENTGSNFMMLQGAVGQLSRDNIVGDTTGMDEYESWSASTKELGVDFAKLIVAADYSLELDPILNAKHKDIMINSENSILVLACETKLVNNTVYYDENGEPVMASEIGYVEFGHKIGFALFPGEFYPEVFWGADIIGDTNWDGTEWQYDSLANSVDGVSVYCVCLANDAIGYVLTDNNFAFMGHIIGESTSDEVLSAGKHIGSFLVGEYLDLINDMVK
ncbi:MAG: hypothetical protein ACI4XH_10660 [Acutalibacteraceae bacterium]